MQGKHNAQVARAHYSFGDEAKFLQSINTALEIAEQMRDNVMNLTSLDEILCEQAAGYARLAKPEQALEIYQKTDKLRPFRPLREQGSYTLEKALAYLYMGELNRGIEYAIKGLQLASEYRSKRHIRRMDVTYNRLKLMPLGQDKRLNTLHDAIIAAQKKQEAW